MTTLLDWDLEAAAGPRTPCLTKAAQGQIEVVVGVQRSGKAPCTGEREPTIRPRPTTSPARQYFNPPCRAGLRETPDYRHPADPATPGWLLSRLPTRPLVPLMGLTVTRLVDPRDNAMRTSTAATTRTYLGYLDRRAQAAACRIGQELVILMILQGAQVTTGRITPSRPAR